MSPLSTALAAALMLVCGAISMRLSLGLHRALALATLRYAAVDRSDHATANEYACT